MLFAFRMCTLCVLLPKAYAQVADNCTTTGRLAHCRIGDLVVGSPLAFVINAPVNCSFTGLPRSRAVRKRVIYWAVWGAGDVFAAVNISTTTTDFSAADDDAVVPVEIVPVNADLSLFITDVNDPVLAGGLHQQVCARARGLHHTGAPRNTRMRRWHWQVYTVFNTGTATADGIVLEVTIDTNAIVNFFVSLNPGCSFVSPRVA